MLAQIDMIEAIVLGVIGSLIASAILGNSDAGDILGGLASAAAIIFVSLIGLGLILWGFTSLIAWLNWWGFAIVSLIVTLISSAIVFMFWGYYDTTKTNVIKSFRVWIPAALFLTLFFNITTHGGFVNLLKDTIGP